MVEAGILIIDKPKNRTSHDVVDDIRIITGTRKVGHTGTLDPGATGVLVICLGQATRIASLLQTGQKQYRAMIKFGISTTTHDSDGEVTEQRSCVISESALRQVLKDFTGTISQVPPMVSAISINGQRLHRLARQGIEIERAPREVSIDKLELEEFTPGDWPQAVLNVTCSTGTYVRSLCYDIGKALGLPAHMAGLVRIKNGEYSLEQAHTIEQVEQAAREGRLDSLIIPIDEGLSFLDAVEIDEEFFKPVKNGAALLMDMTMGKSLPDGIFRVRCRGSLMAVYRKEKDDSKARPLIVFA